MSGYNRAILLGNVVADFDLRETPNGTPVTDLRLAVNDGRSDDTLFINVTLWSRLAEIASEYLSKGSPVLVEGRLQLDTWTSADGVRRQTIKMIADGMKLVDNRKTQDNNTVEQESSEQTSKSEGENGVSEEASAVPF